MTCEIWEKGLFTQFIAVTIALLGCFAWLIARREEKDWYVLAWFLGPYGVWGFALTWQFLIRADPSCGDVEAWFAASMAYADMVFLSILVNRTGGVGGMQSVFTPLYVITPPVSAAVLQDIQFGMLHIFLITLGTVIGFTYNFRWANPVEIPEDNKRIYNGALFLVLMGSIFLSTFVAIAF